MFFHLIIDLSGNIIKYKWNIW